MAKNGGVIGVSDHGGWAVLVTVARDGTLLDRRRVELVGEGLPKIPHHSEGQGLPLDEGRCESRAVGFPEADTWAASSLISTNSQGG